MTLRIILFDDKDDKRKEAHDAISTALGKKGIVVDFQCVHTDAKDKMYEDRLTLDLLSEPNKGADLIVADRDLSGFPQHYTGLSEATVRRAAEQLGIPECGYARGESQAIGDYVTRGELREQCIRLSLAQGLPNFAARVVSIAEGFVAIKSALKARENEHYKNAGHLLANVLGKPEYSDKISLYASGDTNRLASIWPPRDAARKVDFTACMVGYWLWDSVLRFPGVTLGEIPAASYLNISEATFKDDNRIRDLFKDARYDGPFAAAKVPMWWRAGLDEIVSKSKCEDGRSFAEKELGERVGPARCAAGNHDGAGYYCMLSNAAVCLKHSKGNLSWFPRGADLARASLPKLSELGPWL